MGYFVLKYHLDLVLFASALLGFMGLANFWIRRTGGNPGFTLKAWGALSAIIVLGIFLALGSGRTEDQRLQRTISGLAPTYAEEMALGGLARINEKTPADDPVYLALIQAQVRWQKDNPNIADIYTMGRNSEGKFILLVDSETDYNHNGIIDDDREKRTAIGEVYEEDQDLLEQAINGKAVFTPKPTSDRWGTWISTYVPVFDAQGKPFAVLGVDFDAMEYVHSIIWHRGAMLSLAGMIGMILIGTLGMVSTLRGEMAKRSALQQQLIDASRKAGMADIATGVLHNVGNVLNSVNVSASVIAEKVHAPEMAELAQAAEMLRGHKADMAHYLTQDEAGQHVPEYVAELALFVSNQHQELNQEIAHLTRGIEHIKEIVRTQQQYAKSASVVQEVNPEELLQEAIDLNFTSPSRDGVQIVREIETHGNVAADKHKVLQVLVNLIANAKQAMADSPQKRLTLSVGANPDTGAVVWKVRDSGSGIPAEILSRIFQHGFTTKKDGHGFGLHSCANAATEMDGTLKVRSDGPGQGAEFILEIPIQKLMESAV